MVNQPRIKKFWVAKKLSICFGKDLSPQAWLPNFYISRQNFWLFIAQTNHFKAITGHYMKNSMYILRGKNLWFVPLSREQSLNPVITSLIMNRCVILISLTIISYTVIKVWTMSALVDNPSFYFVTTGVHCLCNSFWLRKWPQIWISFH